jgi:hypothetical protein
MTAPNFAPPRIDRRPVALDPERSQHPEAQSPGHGSSQHPRAGEAYRGGPPRPEDPLRRRYRAVTGPEQAGPRSWGRR